MSRITRKVIEDRLSYLAKQSQTPYRIQIDQPKKYNLYCIEVYSKRLDTWIQLTGYLNSDTTVEIIDALILFHNFFHA